MSADPPRGPLDGTEVLAMFPLGGVLVPSMVIPLHVFEDRYRVMVRHCLETTSDFGVVLIERGSEVGGGDDRSDVGTRARIVEAEEAPDGRWALRAVGLTRIRVVRWLDDDPYPRAEVEDWPDEATGDGDANPEVLAGLRDSALGGLRRALALHAEAGDSAPPATVSIDPHPEAASHQMTVLAPLGPFDQHRLLATPGTAERLRLLGALLDDAAEVLRLRLSGA